MPFVRGGAELLVGGLLAELTRRGYRAAKVSVPFKWYPKAIYDLCGTPYSDFADTERDVRLRDRLIALDNEALAESTRLFTIAGNTTARLARSLGDAGYDRARAITWHGVVDRLMADG